MKAYAYTETYSRTAHLDNSTTFYVLRYNFISAITGGTGQITTTDPSTFEKVLREEEQKGVVVIRSKLPLLVRSIDETTFDHNVSETRRAEVKRVPFERAT